MSSASPVVLLTGASRGLGLKIAELLLNGGSAFEPANVVTLSRSKPEALAKLERDSANTKTSLLAIQGDAGKDEDCKHAVDTAIKKFGRLSGLILNAGVIEFKRLADVSPSAFVDKVGVNVATMITPLHHAIPHLRSSNGKVVFVSSGAATGKTASWGAYNASKAAMNAIARTLANEESKLAVYAIRPGVVDTEMQRLIREEAKEAMLPEEYKKFETKHKNSELLAPEQPGHVIAALAVSGQRKGAGENADFVDWNSEELKAFQLAR